MAEVTRDVPGKLDFVRQALRDRPGAGLKDINGAWRDSGHPGTISRSSLARVRAEMGRAGPASGTARPEPGEPARPPRAEREEPAETGAPPAREGPTPGASGRRRVLREVEEGLDRLLSRVVALGDVPEVEEAIREVRRAVVLASLPCRPRVAVVGASTDRAKFGNKAVRAFARAGFEVHPINPNADRVEGLRAFASLDDLPVDRLDRVSLYVPAPVGLRVLDQLTRKRVGQVWLNPGADAPEVVERARALGFEVVQACSILAVGEHPERL